MSSHSTSFSRTRVTQEDLPLRARREGESRRLITIRSAPSNCPEYCDDYVMSLSPGVVIRRRRSQDQAISPWRSMKRPVPAPGPSVARATIASVPSVTVWEPLCPFMSVAV